MQIKSIPKKGGGKRVLYIPNRAEKAPLTAAAGQLAKKAARLDRAGVVHGFARGRSPVTNALAHVESVTAEKLAGKLSADELALVLVDGAARQGLPTSPAVANIAASDLDRAILKWVAKTEKQLIYTRYADDLTFSFDDAALIAVLRRKIPEIVGRCGFVVNEHKTHVQAAVAGRRVICGVGVDAEGVHPTRWAKRHLRAAKHAGNDAAAAGLAEWCRLRPPKVRNELGADERGEMESACKAWRLKVPPWYKSASERGIVKAQSDQDFGDGCVITSDLIMTLGMSTVTDGWKSCVAHPSGQYRHSVWVWAALEGTSIAANLSSKEVTFGNVTRKRMAARCLVHQLRDGRLVYDRLYPEGTEAADDLREHLEAAGYISVVAARRLGGTDGRVVGYVPDRAKPWCDSLSASRIKLTGNRQGLVFAL
ncbi:MAG: reverse transcriptase family protein [Acidimicrobiales bacterium]